jgi:hypothetical protein
LLQRRCRLHRAHAFAAAAGHRLDQQWVTDVIGRVSEGRIGLIGAPVPGQNRHANAGGEIQSRVLAAHNTHGRDRRADEVYTGLFAGLGELAILREKSVAGMHGVGATGKAGVDNGMYVKVAVGCCCRSDAQSLVGKVHVHGTPVGIRVDGDAANAETSDRADDATRDPEECSNALAALGAGALARDTPGDVGEHRLVDGSIGYRRYQLLRGRHGMGTVFQQLGDKHIGAFIEPIPGAYFVNQAETHGGARIEAFGAQEQATRLAGSDSLDDEGTDGGGDQAELDFRERKTRINTCYRDVTTGNQSDAAAKGVAVDDSQCWAREACELVEHVSDLARILQIFLFRVLGHAPHPIQIGAGGKALAAADDPYHPHMVVAGQLIQCFTESADEHIVERVVHIGAIENQRSDATFVDLGQYWCSVHVTS